MTLGERSALSDHAAKVAANATAHIRAFGATSPAAAADAARAASDTLHVAAAVLRSRPLRDAADVYDRAAREPFGRLPALTPAGNQLRRAARVMATYARLSGDRTNTAVGLSHARKTVKVTVGPDTYEITVEPGTTVTAARTSSRDIRRHKASNYD